MSETFVHAPVMVAEVLEAFASVPDGLVVDATVGGAGHAQALLDARSGLSLLGLDRDREAVRAARAALDRFGERATVVQARFDTLGAALELAGRNEPLVGVLFDLGVSSHQLEVARRGFSYRESGPLDMRMDQESGATAGRLVNEMSEEELAALFAEHGEDRFARRIARAVVAARPLETTTALAEVVSRAVPAAARRRGHPARRVFQALRVAVNEELEQLEPALEEAIERLEPGGRLVVLAYHSGEDRLVKAIFEEAASGGCTCPPGLPCVCGARPRARVMRRSARLATAAEIERNPRAEAARLRTLERVDVGAGR